MKYVTSKRGNKKFNNKGQITVFIILGIVILFIVALAVYLQQSNNQVRPPVQQLVVDEEVKPIQLYVTDCLTSTAKDALIRLGQNGGYIDVTGMRIDPRPYNSDVLLFEPQQMPYWYYLKSCTQSKSGCLTIRNPPVCNNGVDCALPYKGPGSMEEQLNKYIETHIGTCINNFAPFSERFTVLPGEIKVDSRIAETDVGFKLDYPLKVLVKGSDRQSNIPYFYTSHDIKLKKIYTFAQEIRDAEANYTFLERNTLNLITIYSGIDSAKLPPVSGIEMFTSGKKYWIRTEVKQKLMNDILPYTLLLQIMNAGNAKTLTSRSTDPKYITFEDGLYKSMNLKVSNNTYFDLNANIYYPPGSDIYFRIGNSEVIKPKNFDAGDSIIMKLVNFAMSDYSFKYDITYPVIVKISDPDAFKGEGFTFSYAMQANIRQNVPVSTNITVVSVVGSPSIDLEGTLQKTNRTINIDTYDKYTKKPVDGVIISYKCGEQYSIGQTVTKNNKAVLQDRFPFCEFGGEIVYEKAGYMSGAIDFDNPEGSDEKYFRIELWPLQEKHVKVYKRTQTDINKIRRSGVGGIVLYATSYTNITPSENVFLNIARIKEDSRDGDVPLVGFMVYKHNNVTIRTITRQDQIDQINKLFSEGLIEQAVKDSMLADLNLLPNNPVQQIVQDNQEYIMDFVPGTYNIDAFTMYNGPVTVAAETKTFCPVPKILGICVAGEKTLNLPQQNFSSWINGGVKTSVVLTENDVYSNNTLVIFVAEMPLPTNWDMLEKSPTIEDYQKDKLALLRPTVE
jgi:hypothetical protein